MTVAVKLLEEKLQKIANQVVWSDDAEFMVNDYAGGNIDDAFYGGQDDGAVQLARELLAEFFQFKDTQS